MPGEAMDGLSERTEKEAHLGGEGTARIHWWGFDHIGIHPTSAAPLQAQKCT